VIDLIDGDSGAVVVRVPEDAIEECSHPGPCDGDVASWLASGELEWIMPTPEVRRMLAHWGTWADLETASEEEIRGRALWILCGSEAENRRERNR